MKSEFRTTILMMLIALGAVATAAFFYPWPEADLTSDQIDKPLFADLDMERVRSIEILRFNDDRNELESIRIRLSADKWIFPDKGNFVATQSTLIATVRASLNECKVREFMSDQEEDHIKYGVVDPTRYGTSIRASLGTELILRDRQGKVIASLIVGKGVKSDAQVPQRFVRIPEQPNVYVVDYDARILTTRFSHWVDSNLLHLATQANPNGLQTAKVIINKYRIDPAKIANPDSREIIYRALFSVNDNQFSFTSLEIPGSDRDTWKAITPNQIQMPELASWTRVIAQIVVTDVNRKSKNLISVLRNPTADADEQVLNQLDRFGFSQVGFADGAFQFQSTGGDLSLTTPEGVRLNLWVGSVDTNTTNTESGSLARYLMITVDVDYDMFPKLEPSSDDPNDKTYLRAVEDRKNKLANARQTATDLNRTHADWFYIVDSAILDNLVPDLTIDPDSSSATSETIDSENPSPIKTGDDESKKVDESKVDEPDKGEPNAGEPDAKDTRAEDDGQKLDLSPFSL